MTVPRLNWTCDPETQQANRSAEFIRIRDVVAGVIAPTIRSFLDAAALKPESDFASQLAGICAPNVVAQLTHAHDFSPIHMKSAESGLLSRVLTASAESNMELPIDLKGCFPKLTQRNAFVAAVGAKTAVDYVARNGPPSPRAEVPSGDTVVTIRWMGEGREEYSRNEWRSRADEFYQTLGGEPFTVTDAPEGSVVEDLPLPPDDDAEPDCRVPTADLAIYFRDALAAFLP